MSTIKVILPECMKTWVEEQTQAYQFDSASDYLRDLIRREQNRIAKVEAIQSLIAEGLDSGASEETMEELRATARAVSEDK